VRQTRIEWGGGTSYFLALCVDISKTLRDMTSGVARSQRLGGVGKAEMVWETEVPRKSPSGIQGRSPAPIIRKTRHKFCARECIRPLAPFIPHIVTFVIELSRNSHINDFLQRVSIASYAERCISHDIDSVSPSVTVRYHAKTTPATIMRSSLKDSPITLVSSTLDFTAKFQGEHRERERRMREG